SRQLDHPLRLVSCDDLAAKLPHEPLGQLTLTTPDLEDPLRSRFCDCFERNLASIRALGEPIGSFAPGQAHLGRVLLANAARVVEPHCSTMNCPGTPRLGALPPSQALTVAPTSANSPSWMRPAAFFPSTYASSSACSREWSVEGVVGSQPWSEVRMRRSPGRSAPRMSGSRRSKSCRQRWKLTGSLRC